MRDLHPAEDGEAGYVRPTPGSERGTTNDRAETTGVHWDSPRQTRTYGHPNFKEQVEKYSAN